MSDQRYVIACTSEIAAWKDLYRHAPVHMRQEFGLMVKEIQGGSLLCVAGIDHPLLNRAWVFTPQQETLAAIARRYRELGVKRYFIHTKKRLEAAVPMDGEEPGLVRFRRNWVKLVGRIDRNAPRTAKCALQIREAKGQDADDCARLYCEGFDIPVQAAAMFAAVVGQPKWRVFVAINEQGRAVGTGFLFVGEGRVAYLAGAATQRAYRGRGIQSAILAARLRAAGEVGCDWIASETGESAPGDPQHSQHNMERYGLEVVGVTENLVPASMSWEHGALQTVPHRVDC